MVSTLPPALPHGARTCQHGLLPPRSCSVITTQPPLPCNARSGFTPPFVHSPRDEDSTKAMGIFQLGMPLTYLSAAWLWSFTCFTPVAFPACTRDAHFFRAQLCAFNRYLCQRFKSRVKEGDKKVKCEMVPVLQQCA